MKTQRLTCDVCESTEDVPLSLWTGHYERPKGWLTIRIARAPDWYPQKNPVSLGTGMFSLPDAWPGLSRWQENVSPPRDVNLDLCSESCAFKGMRKLHEGARVVDFAGLDLTATELSFVLNHRSDGALANAVAMREP